MTRAYNTATTQQNSGGAVAGVTAGKNAIINGGFEIWQRGTSFTPGASINYTADRWVSWASSGNFTVTRQVTGDTTNLPNIQYCIRAQRNSGSTGTLGYYMSQSFETANSIPFAGKTVTVSFYARKGANYSATSNNLTVVIATGTGTDQNYENSYTGNTTALNQTATLTSTWQRFSYSTTLSSSMTEMCVQFYSGPTGTAGANDYYEITGVQLEVGSVATPFSRAGGDIQGEIAKCQRYFHRWADGSKNGNAQIGLGNGQTSTQIEVPISFKQTMRIAPSMTYSNLSHFIGNSAGSNIAPTAIAVYDGTNDMIKMVINTGTGSTAGYVWRWSCQSASATLDFSAEL